MTIPSVNSSASLVKCSWARWIGLRVWKPATRVQPRSAMRARRSRGLSRWRAKGGSSGSSARTSPATRFAGRERRYATPGWARSSVRYTARASASGLRRCTSRTTIVPARWPEASRRAIAEPRSRAAASSSDTAGGTTRSIKVPPCGWTSEGISGLLWGLGGEPAVQAALGLGEGAPAPGARVLAGADRRRAGRAPDARVAALVERIGGDLALAHARPHVGAGPCGQRVDLHETELGIALHHAGAGALRRLVAPDGGDPGIELQHLDPQRLDLAQVAAQIRGALPQGRPVRKLLLGDGDGGLHAAHANAVPALQLAPQRERLARDRLQQHAPLGAEGGREADPPREALRRPAQRRLRRGAFQLGDRRGDVGGGHRETSRRATGASLRVAAGKAVKRTPTVNTMVASAVRSARSGTLPASRAPAITPGTAPASTARASAGSSRPANPCPAAATRERTKACARSVPTSCRARSGKNRARTKMRIDPLPTVVTLTRRPVANPMAATPAGLGEETTSSGIRRR